MSNDLVSRLRSHAEWGEAGPKANDGKLLKEAATALEEARAEIERLRSTTVGDWASQRENDALTIEKYQWKERALAAESEHSTLRARVREVVGPFARMSSILGFAGATEHDDVELSGEALHGALEAARQLMEEVK